jgi:flagellar protein FliO/FliZ
MEATVVALRVALSLAVVFGLIWFIHRRLTRGGKARNAAMPITVLGKQAVGQKASVVVIDADGTRFVLGVTEHNVSVLHSAESPAAAFAGVLAQATPAATVPTPAAIATPPALADGLVAPGSRIPGALAGSILSPATWRQTASALGRNR